MKIISWNIRAGGGVRAQQIVDYLLNEQADIIVLSEFRATSASISIAAALKDNGYQYQRTTADKACPALNSLLVASHFALRKLKLKNAPRVPARWLAVNVYAERPMCVVAVHVPNRHTGQKYPFLQAVADVTARWRGLPAVIAGDTNSGRISLDEENAVFNQIEDGWIESMDRRGWRDAFRLQQPQGREFTWYSPNGKNGFRLDQMFVHPALVADISGFSHQWVGATNARRDEVSDHAALLLELRR